MNMTPLLAAASFVLLSGCTGAGADATLEYDGAASGTHSDAVQCDDQGTISGSGHVPDGAVRVTLRDSAGKLLLQQTFQDDFTLEAKSVSGASGAWSFEAMRTGDDVVGDAFRGDYKFHVTC